MKRLMLFVLLLLVPLIAMGERSAFDAKIIKLTEKGNDEYKLRMIQLSQPFGYKHNQDIELVIHLRFECPIYECSDEETQPTLKKYHQAIALLKNQLADSKTIKFGVVDRGFAEIEGEKNEYQSNALEIVDGIVCSDYDFFEF